MGCVRSEAEAALHKPSRVMLALMSISQISTSQLDQKRAGDRIGQKSGRNLQMFEYFLRFSTLFSRTISDASGSLVRTV